MKTKLTQRQKQMLGTMKLSPSFEAHETDGMVSLYRESALVGLVGRGVAQTYERDAETEKAVWRIAARVFHQSRSVLGPLL